MVGYRAGDLERHYPELGLEEDYLYAYGVVPEATWRLLHPRAKRRLSKGEMRVWELVCAQAKMHPRELEPHLGRRRQVNAWGGYSKETTRMLEVLHYCGLLRVAGREKGIRIYQAARAQEEFLAPAERLRRLVLLIAQDTGTGTRAEFTSGDPALGACRTTFEGAAAGGKEVNC